MARRGKQRTLSKEELELWARVTAKDAPLLKAQAAAKRRRPPADGMEAKAPLPAEDTSSQSEPSRRKVKAPLLAMPAPPPKAPMTGPEPFDYRLGRKLARGRRPIDATLDLHGYRQHTAHVALKRFLLGAQLNGLRNVLIITGKGKSGPLDIASDEPVQYEERGVLRRMVPYWLGDPEFRDLVAGFTNAARQHGGDGALYVTIKRARGRLSP